MQDALLKEFATDADPRDLLAGFMATMKLSISTYLAVYQHTLPIEEGGVTEGPEQAAAGAGAREAALQMALLHIEQLTQIVRSSNPFVTCEALGMQFQLMTVNVKTKETTRRGPLTDENRRKVGADNRRQE